jgi:hypothetical protein
MDSYERQQVIKEMHEMLREQRELVASSKEEAEKLLTELGIMHLLVPKGTNKPAQAHESDSTGK